ncbi:MAG: Rieske 2Fe-2S domain-containing protein [Anaerolineae bacterium]|nr:Rieske 2Fe-2S domain-containing protein [Anaerolineae bacterium]
MNAAETLRKQVDALIASSPEFKNASDQVASFIHKTILNQGETAREVADTLHGKQIGHPLHPILTDLTITGWTLGTVFDFFALFTHSRQARTTADVLTIMGTLSAVPTVISGLTDFSTVDETARSHVATHGITNSIALFCFFRSTVARMQRQYLKAFGFSVIGLGFATFGAWMGGDLVYRHKVGVDHADRGFKPVEWTPVLAAAELKNDEAKAVTIDDHELMLYRKGKAIYVLGAKCSHAGGPLPEGKIIDGNCVQCPWHDSVFDMRTGEVVHGPATYAQPYYEVRVNDDQIEVRMLPVSTPVQSQSLKAKTSANGNGRVKRSAAKATQEKTQG